MTRVTARSQHRPYLLLEILGRFLLCGCYGAQENCDPDAGEHVSPIKIKSNRPNGHPTRAKRRPMPQDFDDSFSLVRGGVMYNLLVKLRVIPRDGLGIARRILLSIAITWVPLVVLAA